jgi:hypothetical protein
MLGRPTASGFKNEKISHGGTEAQKLGDSEKEDAKV